MNGSSTPTKADILAPLFKSASMVSREMIFLLDILHIVVYPSPQVQITAFLLFHRKRGFHTSALIWLYMFLESVLFLPVFYQIFIDSRYYSPIEIVLIVLYFWGLIATLILCSFSDGPIWPADEPHPSKYLSNPETNASFLNQITYWWFTPMAIAGWKKSLTGQDLWDLRKDMKTRYLYPEFAARLKKYVKIPHKAEKSSSHQEIRDNTNDAGGVQFRKEPAGTRNRVNIIKIFAKIYMGHFLLAAFCKLSNDLVQFITPQLLK